VVTSSKSKNPRRWLTVFETAEALRVHPVTIRKALSRGQIPFAKKPGIGIRIDWPRLERELERLEVGQKGKLRSQPKESAASNSSQESK